MKIIAKPFDNEEIVNKSRKITGIDKWARSSRTIGTVMLVLGWLTIPFEVIFRRDFGQRWFTYVTFIAGLLLMVSVHWLQSFIFYVHDSFYNVIEAINPVYKKPVTTVPNQDQTSYWIFVAYYFMGPYHLFKIRWRKQAHIPQHSFDDGTSRFRWLGNGLAWLLNQVVIPYTLLFWLLIPRKQRKDTNRPEFITDRVAFTDIVVEPLLVMALAFTSSGVYFVWLMLSAIALFVHAYWKDMARRTKAIDFQDSKVEAEIMRELRNGKKDQAIVKMEPAAPAPQPLMRLVIQYPKLNVIIDELHSENLKRA